MTQNLWVAFWWNCTYKSHIMVECTRNFTYLEFYFYRILQGLLTITAFACLKNNLKFVIFVALQTYANPALVTGCKSLNAWSTQGMKANLQSQRVWGPRWKIICQSGLNRCYRCLPGKNCDSLQIKWEKFALGLM